MENENEFQFQIDGILKEARNSSVITISCMKTRAGKASGNKEEITALSVNGFTDPHEFKKSLRHLAMKVELDTMQKQAGLVPFLRSQLLEEMNEAVTEMRDKTVRQLPGTCLCCGGPSSGDAWEFISPDIRIRSKRVTDPELIKKVNEGVKEYALAYRQIFARLISKLGILSSVVQYLRTDQEEILPEKNGKIPITVSVSKFATLMRLNYEFGMFGDINKTVFSHIISLAFCSASNEAISPGSFRNQFNMPEIKSLEFCKEFFKRLNEIDNDLNKRYHDS